MRKVTMLLVGGHEWGQNSYERCQIFLYDSGLWVYKSSKQ